MNRTDIAYLINTTPKYYYLLYLHLTLLGRYAKDLQWPVYIASEVPDHPDLVRLKTRFPQINILPLTQEEEPFLESRLAACRKLPSTIDYVFPIQEDFLLEGRPMEKVLEEAVEILDESPSVASLRLMPSPGPVGRQRWGETDWVLLEEGKDSYIFTYQATLWRRTTYESFFQRLLEFEASMVLGTSPLTKEQKVRVQIQWNLAENSTGQSILMREQGPAVLHLAWPREGPQPNAVYLSPWPYRPTAVVRGQLESWAEELAAREDCPLAPSLR
jgi:hypothetical protein